MKTNKWNLYSEQNILNINVKSYLSFGWTKWSKTILKKEYINMKTILSKIKETKKKHAEVIFFTNFKSHAAL